MTDGTQFHINRRVLCRALALGLIAMPILPRVVKAAAPGERMLSFHHLHTGDRISAVYWRDGRYVPDALRQINCVLRDHYSGEVKEIDVELLDVLYEIHQKLKAQEPFHVISGYRSPTTNAMLRQKGRRVGKNSMHILGKAVDVRLLEHKLDSLRRVAVAMRRGGVGYYPKSGFVHVDVGRVRYW